MRKCFESNIAFCPPPPPSIYNRSVAKLSYIILVEDQSNSASLLRDSFYAKEYKLIEKALWWIEDEIKTVFCVLCAVMIIVVQQPNYSNAFWWVNKSIFGWKYFYVEKLAIHCIFKMENYHKNNNRKQYAFLDSSDLSADVWSLKTNKMQYIDGRRCRRSTVAMQWKQHLVKCK